MSGSPLGGGVGAGAPPPEDIIEDLPLAAVEAALQRQYNLIERIKSWLDVDDDALAFLIAQGVVQQQTQQDILATLRGQPLQIPDEGDIEVIIEEVPVTIEFPEEDVTLDADLDATAIGDAVGDALSTGRQGRLISFPRNGGRFSFPAGSGAGSRHEMDLLDGEVTVTGVGTKDTEGDLQAFDTELAQSAALWADDKVVIRTFDNLGELTGVWELATGYVSVDATAIQRVEIDAPRPFEFHAQFSTGDDPPLAAAPVGVHQRRYGHLTRSANSLSAIPFVGQNFGDYSESSLNDAADTHGASDIFGGTIGQHHYIVQNVSPNDAEVQARNIDITGEQVSADNDIHGSVDTANTNVETVSANDFVVLESNFSAEIFRLMAQAATGGNEVELEVQYHGLSPSIRGS